MTCRIPGDGQRFSGCTYCHGETEIGTIPPVLSHESLSYAGCFNSAFFRSGTRSSVHFRRSSFQAHLRSQHLGVDHKLREPPLRTPLS